MEDQHSDFVSPAALPAEINKRSGALRLYEIAIFALAGVGAVGLLGVLVLAGMGRTVPDGAIVLASVAVGALAGMIGGQAVKA